jgi:hypothetical protein
MGRKISSDWNLVANGWVRPELGFSVSRWICTVKFSDSQTTLPMRAASRSYTLDDFIRSSTGLRSYIRGEGEGRFLFQRAPLLHAWLCVALYVST